MAPNVRQIRGPGEDDYAEHDCAGPRDVQGQFLDNWREPEPFPSTAGARLWCVADNGLRAQLPNARAAKDKHMVGSRTPLRRRSCLAPHMGNNDALAATIGSNATDKPARSSTHATTTPLRRRSGPTPLRCQHAQHFAYRLCACQTLVPCLGRQEPPQDRWARYSTPCHVKTRDKGQARACGLWGSVTESCI